MGCPMKYILSLSFGKDSMALLIKIKELGLPLDEVIFCDIMFDKSISGEMPLMAQFIPYAEKILKEKFNITVKHLTADKNFKEWFYTTKKRGKYIGDNYGFPLTLHAWCNDRLKMQPINKYFKRIEQPITEYIGIAKDEPKRLERYKALSNEKHKYITLADLDITETEALELCRKHGLLSPIYESSFRGGCWFCPKQSIKSLKYLYTHYPSYWDLLLQMEQDSRIPFRPNYTLAELGEKFKQEAQ